MLYGMYKQKNKNYGKKNQNLDLHLSKVNLDCQFEKSLTPPPPKIWNFKSHVKIPYLEKSRFDWVSLMMASLIQCNWSMYDLSWSIFAWNMSIFMHDNNCRTILWQQDCPAMMTSEYSTQNQGTKAVFT